MAEVLADSKAQQELADTGLNMEALSGLDFSTLEYLCAPDFIGVLNINMSFDADITMDMLEG